ncbi:aminoacyl-tRNA hydrolase [Candidatus Dojkabacteria bacterium]|nr:aminoacyl-tRNA hydrolase [Candidatus Dojkabacteria bacterium]
MRAKVTKRQVIIGLGNPGREYEKTRHNVGFAYINFLLQKYRIKGINEKKLKNSIVYEVGEDLILVKPQTFMNNSGLSVREVVKWYKVDVENELILVHDDLDIPLGKVKIQEAKSPREHRGVKSVEDHLGSVHFTRIRIGIEHRNGRKIHGEDYVLKEFDEKELVEIQRCFEENDVTLIA